MAKSTSKRTDVSKGAFAAEATVSDRIAATLATLTPAHQRMAEYVLANPFRAATMRIDEFAAARNRGILRFEVDGVRSCWFQRGFASPARELARLYARNEAFQIALLF